MQCICHSTGEHFCRESNMNSDVLKYKTSTQGFLWSHCVKIFSYFQASQKYLKTTKTISLTTHSLINFKPDPEFYLFPLSFAWEWFYCFKYKFFVPIRFGCQPCVDKDIFNDMALEKNTQPYGSHYRTLWIYNWLNHERIIKL